MIVSPDFRLSHFDYVTFVYPDFRLSHFDYVTFVSPDFRVSHFDYVTFVSPDFRLSHFDYVKVEDLEKIGMGKPAVRRLLDAVKRKKATLRKKGILEKVFSGSKLQPLFGVNDFCVRYPTCVKTRVKCIGLLQNQSLN